MATKATPKTNRSTQGLESRIAELAYWYYLREGRPHGKALQHWLAAEADLRASVAAPAAAPKAAPTRSNAAKPSKPARLEFVVQDY